MVLWQHVPRAYQLLLLMASLELGNQRHKNIFADTSYRFLAISGGSACHPSLAFLRSAVQTFHEGPAEESCRTLSRSR